MRSISERAIRWYDTSARDLPWRPHRTRSVEPSSVDTHAWGVLVSEIMLQQTPVARVQPVWLDWMQRWPTPSALARASAGDAIRAWGRLGYPRRALRLHACATEIAARHGGVVPADLTVLLGLPGVGAYTARAIATFAYGQRHPVVDTNVRRLVARAHLGVADGGDATTVADLRVVEDLLPVRPERAARASIAFMELGALVCTARAPSCGDCPLRTVCAWQRAGCPPTVAGRPRKAQGYAGTDRQVRGLLLGLVRSAPGPVERSALDDVWPDAVRRTRALDGLLTDGLLVEHEGLYTLPR